MRHEYFDFVFPGNKQEEFVSMALKLGYSGLYFCYDTKEIASLSGKIDSDIADLMKNNPGFEIKKAAFVTNEADIQKMRKKGFFVIFQNQKETNTRSVVERSKPDIISNLEFQSHDFIHHRSSGINQVIAQIMKKNNVSYGISLSLLFSTKYKPEILGRIKQNISFSRKYKLNAFCGSFASDPYSMRGCVDVISLLIILGASSREAKSFLENNKI